MRACDRGRLLRALDARRDRRPAVRRVEERQVVGPVAEHRHAERLEQLGGRRHVEQRLHARRDDERLRRRERAQVGRHVGRRRPAAVDAAEPAGRHDRIPAARHTASVPPTVVAPTARCTTAAARSRGPSLRASASNRCSSSRRQPDDDLAVEHADRRRHRAASRTAPPTRARPRRLRRAGSRARRASSRARRPRVAVAHLLGDADHGIAPSFAQQRAAVAMPSSAPPTRKPAASASPAPVVSTTSTSTAGWSTPSTLRPRAPRFSTQRVVERADRLAARARSRRRGRARARATRRAERVVDERPRREVERDRSRRARGRRGRRVGRGRDRLAQQRVAGDVEHVAIEPRRLELVRRELGRGAAVGGHRAVARRGDRDDDAGPARDRAAVRRRRAARARAGRARRPRRRRAADEASPRRRATPPTRRRSPPGRRGRCACVAGWSSPGTSARVEAHDHVEEQVAEGHDPHGAKLVAWKATVAARGCARSRSAGSSARRACSRRPAARRSRRSRRPGERPGRARGVRGRAVLPRARRRGGAALPRGRRDLGRARRTRVAVGHEVRGGGHVRDRRRASSSNVSRNHAGDPRGRGT